MAAHGKGGTSVKEADAPGASLYRGRRLTESYPGLDSLSLEWFETDLRQRPDDLPRLQLVVRYLDRLVDTRDRKRFVVVGCGPRPEPLRLLSDLGFDVVGVEPVPKFVTAAQTYLGDAAVVLEGSAEQLPLDGASQDVVFLESVLEHVESVGRSLAEAYRVLAPGGVAYIVTTNRHRLVWKDPEFNVRMFALLPNLVKESYVFHHLHYRPSLANYTERPAVHWFTFAELCGLGREAGFHRFYSQLDLKEPDPADFFSGGSAARRLKARVLRHVQRNAWLRAAALSQRGGMIFMVKRHDAEPAAAG
jgi:SAM-dependent methyltransferase